MRRETHSTGDGEGERLLYIDCFSGVAGDMFLGALIDLGLPIGDLEATLRTLDLPSWTLESHRVEKQGISGLKIHFRTRSGESEPAATPTEPDHPTAAHPTSGPLAHHGHGHDEVISEQGDRVHGHRRAGEIKRLIRDAALPTEVQRRALEAFTCLAEAEGRIHDVEPDEVHFHEIGMLDSVLDIVGCAWGLWRLGIDRVESAPPPIGRGWIRCAHGNVPLPAPATSLILEGCPIEACALRRELVTPTGAAILRCWSDHFGELPAGALVKVGWGAGTIDLPDRPNLLRLFLLERPLHLQRDDRVAQLHAAVGEAARSADLGEEQELHGGGRVLVHLEANIDDRSGELIAHLSQALFEAGARDVWSSPIFMKKGRPGVLLSCLADPEHVETLEARIFAEGASGGVRRQLCWRESLPRRWLEVELEGATVRVKVFGGDLPLRVDPEYADCAALSRARQRPLQEIYDSARHAALKQLNAS
ncbi:MAG: nickel pincer cofactor biosynthesis protein LarC [Myxococcota bacterium]|nr:nickel pincer cofactor biosynthesis protein LarC [Myxococcota bacterium]